MNGNLTLGAVHTIAPGRYLVSDAELLQFGKHPGKTNLTDADNALNILRYLMDEPTVAIMKHNNPSGVARGTTLCEAYIKADLADRVAAFGGCIAVNRPLDLDTAREIAARYAEVVVAPEFEEGVVGVLAARKNLRIMKIGAIERLASFAREKFVEFKSLIDGALILQTSFTSAGAAGRGFPCPRALSTKVWFTKLKRTPSTAELADMRFGWLVEAGVSSNSVLYVKDGVTVGIGTGEQDRVGVAEIARDKAYRKLADRLCFMRHNQPYNDLQDAAERSAIWAEVVAAKGGLIGSVMISDAFFPFRDGVEVGLREGVSAVLQPGGSLNDHQVIEAVNEHGAAMLFSGQRSFRH